MNANKVRPGETFQSTDATQVELVVVIPAAGFKTRHQFPGEGWLTLVTFFERAATSVPFA
jgi:hypothetical protein